MANEYGNTVDRDKVDGALTEGIELLGLDPDDLPNGDYPAASDSSSSDSDSDTDSLDN